MKLHPRIFADFNNADRKHRLRLTTIGSINDIEKQNITLKEGQEVLVYDGDEFEVLGIVEFSLEENIWVAKIDWSLIM